MGTRHRRRAGDCHIEIVPRSELRRRRRDEERAGRSVIDGFDLDDNAAPTPRDVTCVGLVSDEESAAAALLAACRGVSLVVAVMLEGPARHRVLEDFAKVGCIVERGALSDAPEAPARHCEEEQILLGHLAAGMSVTEAAHECAMSKRTAHRRLAVLRSRYEVNSTSELIVRAAERAAERDDNPPVPGAPTLVSRDRELARVMTNLSNRRPTALIGEAGIGKTWLARAAAGRQSGPHCEGGSLASVRWSPYLPLARAVGPFPPGADAAAVAHLVIERVGDGVLLLDDLQWADSATLELIGSLAANVAIVVTVRTADTRTNAVLDLLAATGFDCLRLEALGPADALDLVRAVFPELATDRVEEVLDRAGGNPFLLLELARGTSTTLRASLLARLEPLSVPARDSLARLALLGHPADPALLGCDVEALLDAGLAIRIGDEVTLRHELIAAEVLGVVDEERQRQLHLDLAPQLSVGEGARHYWAGGDRERARCAARSAAQVANFPGERARHLLLAAGYDDGHAISSTDCSDLDVVLEAVDAFLEAGELDEARLSIDGLTTADASAEVELRRARMCWHAGDPEGARAAIEVGLGLAAGTETSTEVGLRVEELRYPIRVTFDADRAMSLATDTWNLARRVGVDEARAQVLLGSAHLVAGSAGWLEHIEAALAQAQAEGDLDTTFEASNALVAAHMLAGDRAVARSVAGTGADLARQHHRRHWEEQFAITANLLALLAGRAGEVAQWGRAFVRPHLTVAVHLAHATYAIALADLGLGREAAAVLREGRGLDAGDETGVSLLCWAEAETHWLLGRPGRAADAAEECLRHGVHHFPVRPLAGALRAWAQFDLGIEPIPVDPEGWDFAQAAAHESHGVAALVRGEHFAAVAHFERAAGLATEAPRFALRAQWGAAEALRRADQTAEARKRFLEVEAGAAVLGFLPLVGRARRSLRELGRRAADAGTPAAALTARQHQVLALVADGHTSIEIAAVLGLKKSTVDSHIKVAMQRLGASTRSQAALLAHGDRDAG
jgi:DNA-binding NarL/FixJ family response regulator